MPPRRQRITNQVGAEAGLKLLNSSISEADFQQMVLDFARLQGWLAAHTKDSRRSEPGCYDGVLVRPPRFLVVELKREGAQLRKGHLSPHTGRWLPGQVEWAEAAMGCPGVEYYLWRPSDWPEIVRTLTLKS